MIKIKIDIPWALDKHVVRNVTVISHFDLNSIPNLSQPCTMADSKILCCLCCASGPIVAKLSVLKGGYVPGEDIVFNASVYNKSSKKLRMKAKLVQRVTLHATTKSKEWTRVVAEIPFHKEIGENSCDEWNNSVLTVPAVCGSSNGFCRIIHVSYVLVLECDPSGPSFDLEIAIPIQIGTIPLNNNNNNANTQNNGQHVFQPSYFETSKNKDLMPEYKGKVTLDQDYLPSYPFYKDYTAQ